MSQYKILNNTITCSTNGLYNLIGITVFWVIFLAANILVYTRADTQTLFANASLIHVGLGIFLIILTAGLIPAYNNRKNTAVLVWQFNNKGLLLPQSTATLTHYKSPILIPWDQIKSVSIVKSLHEKDVGEMTYSRNLMLIYFHQDIKTLIPSIFSYNSGDGLKNFHSFALPKKYHSAVMKKLMAIAPKHIDITLMDRFHIVYH